MKTILNTRVAKAISAAALVLIISNPIASLANGGKNEKEKLSDEQVTVQYVGINEEHVVFHVDFTNNSGQKFWLIIKNEQSDIRPTFIIRNSNNEIVRQYAVTRTVTENTVVTKL
jgi:hypothetical protein